MKPGHVRHYMPQLGHRSIGKGKSDTTITFDSFAAFNPRTPILVEWDTDMATRPTRGPGGNGSSALLPRQIGVHL